MLTARLKLCCTLLLLLKNWIRCSCSPQEAVPFGTPELSTKLKICCTVSWTAGSTISQFLIDFVSLAGLSSSFFSLPTATLTSSFPLSLISIFTDFLQLFALSHVSALPSALDPSFRTLLYHFLPSTFLIPSHQSFLAMRTPSSRRVLFLGASELFRSLCGESGSQLFSAHVLHNICRLSYRQSQDAWRRRTSPCDILAPDGNTWQ